MSSNFGAVIRTTRYGFSSQKYKIKKYNKIRRFSVCDLNSWIGVNATVTVEVAPFARGHLWGICAAVSAGSQCVVARFAKALRSQVVESTTLLFNRFEKVTEPH